MNMLTNALAYTLSIDEHLKPVHTTGYQLALPEIIGKKAEVGAKRTQEL